ncbi:predicted protein [Nematostella vectensis]|uniref:C2H2-type domain-containing protein n=1 Tax=Nematostella vectensis TaxID=45351 RepID=A7SQP3_NEMVE|nr:predicted protein [Nematostella vectensis]|eukprot:XP_001626062.1 predicted protein [Nematostella vectensis]
MEEFYKTGTKRPSFNGNRKRAHQWTERNEREKRARYSDHLIPISRRPIATRVFTLPSPASGVEVVYTKCPNDADLWIHKNINSSTLAIGMDIEWRPQFIPKKLGGKENKTATLQLAVNHSCLVLHLFHMRLDLLPRSLLNVLGNIRILKVGSGISGDAVKLLRDTEILCNGRSDTQVYAKVLALNQDGTGLKKLAKTILGIELDKPKYISLSNWELFPLTYEQASYAALDAWVSFKLFVELKQRLHKSGLVRKTGEQHLIETGVPMGKKAEAMVSCKSCGKKYKSKAALLEHIEVKSHQSHVVDDTTEKEESHSRDFVTQLNEPKAEPPLEHVDCKKCGKLFLNKVSKNHKRKCKGKGESGEL